MIVRPRVLAVQPVAGCVSSRARAAIGCGVAVVALLVVAPVAPAWAQGTPPPADSVTVIARQRYQEGVSAYEAHRYEDARASFAQAYALKHHPAVLLNLGQAELRSHHEDDAGNHLQQFLREHTTATPEQRVDAEKGIAEAKRSTGLVTVGVDAPGADVSIDGTTIGKAPLVDPVFVRPGKHTVFASFQGRSGVAAVEVRAGGTAVANVALGAGGVAPPPVPVGPVAPDPGTPVTPPLQPVPGFQPPPQAPPPTSGGHSMTFGEWYSHKPLAWVGTGIAILGLGMGIGGGAAAMSASSASTSDTAAIQNEIAVRHDPQNVCNPAVLAANPTLNNVYGANSASQACPTLQSDIDHYHTGIAVMATGYALLGVGVIGTTIYAMVDWFPQRSGSSGTGKSEPLPIAVAPIVTPTMKGFGAVGRF